jgi:hypothetical protein
MKTCKRCGLSKSKSLFRPDPRYRDGYGSWCIDCHREKNSSWAKENREHLTAKRARWVAANPIAAKDVDKKWKAANKSKTSSRYRAWRLAHLKHDAARVTARRAAKLQAIPKWADKSKISEIYKNRPDGCDIDHIVPLVSQFVCGLHWEGNLQYLPSAENQSKRNFYWPDMPRIENAQRQQKLFTEAD